MYEAVERFRLSAEKLKSHSTKTGKGLIKKRKVIYIDGKKRIHVSDTHGKNIEMPLRKPSNSKPIRHKAADNPINIL